ncbi:MAG: protease HtpX, partial [Bdellovibrionales bacterium]|nr:protease HtpX [Bdellovibrionales bacterium]
LLCTVFGAGGALLSLLISKWVAKTMYGVKVIDPKTNDSQLRELIEVVYDLSKRAGLRKMPEVGLYDSSEVNAFATGPSKNNSLVAVSSGLLNRMNKDQVRGVLGHEIAHVANGDMVTMTLIQAVMNILVMFVARIIAKVVTEQSDNKSFWLYIGVLYAVEIPLGLLGAVVVRFFSRFREYRADEGGARFAGKQNMISALRALQNNDELIVNDQQAIASLKISGGKGNRWLQLLSTHPPLEDRLSRLEKARI